MTLRTKIKIVATIPVRVISVVLQFLGCVGEAIWEWQEAFVYGQD